LCDFRVFFTDFPASGKHFIRIQTCIGIHGGLEVGVPQQPPQYELLFLPADAPGEQWKKQPRKPPRR